MDHIPFASDTPHQRFPLLVPPSAELSVSQAELEDFPYETAWEAEAFLALDFTPSTHRRSVQDIARFVQLWLYFGVLSAALGTAIKVADFCVQDDDGSYYLSTRNLHELILQCLMRAEDPPSRDAWIAARTDLDRATSLLERLLPGLTWTTPGADLDPVYYELEYPLTILCNTLKFTMPQLVSRWARASDLREDSIRLWGGGHTPILLTRLFALRGWCPSDLPRLSELLSTNALSYAITLQRHGFTNHANCTAQNCVINTIDEATYTTQHRTAECTCELVENTCDQASKILAEGTFPLVSLKTFSEKSVHLEVVPFRPGMRYTAISHVWSDGLGNARENAIATCQLLHIKTLLDNFTDTNLIWMDTLCVPLDPRYRKAAIMLMTQTYEDASQVLVLDGELRRVNHLDKPIYEAFARIFISGWMRRVWTLQEGVLARHLFAEFQDGVMDVTKSVQVFNEETNAKSYELDMVPVEFMLVVGVLGTICRLRDKSSEYFMNVWNAIRLRRTTRRGDDILCFASMLHLSLKPIVEAKGPEEKMKACIASLEYVPSGLLWTPGRKLQIDGYRWAPSSFLQEEYVAPGSYDIGRDEKGLRARQFCIFLDKFDESQFPGTAYYEDQDDLVLCVRILHSWSGDEAMPALATRDLAILTEGDVSKAFNSDGDMVAGALVSILGWEGKWGPPCRFECHVSWGTMPRNKINTITRKPVGKCTRGQNGRWHIS